MSKSSIKVLEASTDSNIANCANNSVLYPFSCLKRSSFSKDLLSSLLSCFRLLKQWKSQSMLLDYEKEKRKETLNAILL